MRHLSCFLTFVFCGCLCVGASAQTPLLTWDSNPATVGTIDNLAGSWTNLPSNSNWYNAGTGANQAWNPAAIAQFGSLNSSLGAIITVDEAISVAGMNFLTLAGPLTGDSFQFRGTGSINLAAGATINLFTDASNSSGRYVRFNVPLAGSDLTIAKADGTAQGFFDLAVANPNLTGTLTLKASAAGGGIFANLRPTSITGLSSIVVENGSTLYLNVANAVFSTPITLAGNSAPIRVDSTGNTFTGKLTLSGHSRFHTSGNVVSTTITAPITETAGDSKNFTRSATVSPNHTAPITTTYSGASNYTGTTTLGVSSPLLSTTGITEGGVNVLNFASATAPDDNIFYNNVAANTLNLVGGVGAATVLRMVGAVGETNSQTFSALSLQQGSTGVEVISDTGGTANLNLGSITRSAFTTLAVKGPASGSITGTYNSSPDVFLGPWATYTSSGGLNAGWASLTGGKFSHYTGSLEHVTGTPISAVPGYAATENLRVSSASTGAITVATGTTNIATVSMTDTGSARTLDIGSGNILRLAAVGGLQIINGARDFTVGAPGDTSVLTAGGTANNVAGELILTNSSSSHLTVNSVIANNGTGSVAVILNGSGRTILTGANTFSGHVFINSGVLEVRHNAALGVANAAASLTKIMTGAALHITDGLTIAEGIQVNGHGIAMDGAIRSSGNATVTGVVRAQSSSRFASDSGLLTLGGGIVTQTTGTALFFSGAGNTEITGSISGTTPILFKEGTGTLTLSGTSSATGTTTLSSGRLHLNFSGASAPATNILYSAGATVGGLAMNEGSSFSVTGKAGATNSQAFTTLTLSNAGKYRLSVNQNGAAAINVNFTTLTRNPGTLVQFDSTAAAGFTTTSGSANALLTGTGGVAYATLGLDDWAATATANASKNIVGLSTLGGYNSSGLSGNADVTASTSIGADTTVATLRFNTNTGGLLTLSDSAGGTKYLTTGGILVTPNVGANDILISAGALRAPSGASELIIFQNNTQGALRISSRITNSAAATPGATTLIKAGLGTVILETNVIYNSGTFGNAYFTSGTRVMEGNLQFASTLTTGATLLYPVYSAGDLTLGSGATSAKVIIGSGTAPVNLWGGIAINGSGTANAIVGGSSVLSGYTHHKDGVVRDFRKGIIGGTGPNENNLTLTLNTGTLQLGPVNTYIGKTTIGKQTIEVEKLADTGSASSLGTGSYDAASSVIDMAGGGSSGGAIVTATLRYTGSTDSETNRVIHLTNSTVATTQATASIENTGNGTVKFTSAFTAGGTSTAQRTFILGGTNMGDNQIVSIGNATSAPTAPGVKLEKTGTGTWILTGASTHSGGTTVSGGTLLIRNSSMVGSATGSGTISVATGSTLGGNGRIAPAANNSITLQGGMLSVGIPSSASAGLLQISTSGTGTLSLDQNAIIALDLFHGVGQNNTLDATAADILAVSGTLTLGPGAILKVSNPNNLAGFTEHDQWKLFDWSNLTGPILGTFASVDLPDLGPGLQWDLSQIYSTGILATMLVPEPSRSLFLFLALGVMLGRRRR